MGKGGTIEDADLENAWFPTPVASVKHFAVHAWCPGDTLDVSLFTSKAHREESS